MITAATTGLWECVAIGCRHRADATESPAAVGAPSTCGHAGRRGKPCDAANALACPLVGILMTRAASTVAGKLTGGATDLFSKVSGWFSGSKGKTRKPNPAAEPDPYKVLGLPRTATLDEVKARFRELSLKFHPDRCSDPGADARFAAITAAYAAITKTDEGV